MGSSLQVNRKGMAIKRSIRVCERDVGMAPVIKFASVTHTASRMYLSEWLL